jgi:hypothetical protein
VAGTDAQVEALSRTHYLYGLDATPPPPQEATDENDELARIVCSEATA